MGRGRSPRDGTRLLVVGKTQVDVRHDIASEGRNGRADVFELLEKSRTVWNAHKLFASTLLLFGGEVRYIGRFAILGCGPNSENHVETL